jgi:hypothetical protein
MTTPILPLSTLPERPAAAPWGGRVAGRWLLALADPEWPLVLAGLLAPAACALALGQAHKAPFFLGAAVYVAVLKWLGWLVFGRWSPARPRFLLLPAELFAGLAVACAWFYLRNVLALVWPGSYSLRELAWLFPALLLLHAIALALRAPGLLAAARPSPRPLLAALAERLGLYAPFVAMLTVALWSIGGATGVTGTDPIQHTFTARVYLYDGLDFAVPPTEVAIFYPAGFGAMNATAAALAPLSIVQAFHVQHVLLCVAAVFLVTATVASLLGRPLPLLHAAALPFLFLFPLYALYPDLFYPGTPKQVGLPLFAAVCLLPVVAPVARVGPLLLALGVTGLLAALATGLNPACGPYAALATAVAAAVYVYRAGRSAGWPRWRVLTGQAALALLAGALILGGDPYYRALLPGRPAEPAPEAPAAESAASAQPAFSLAKGLRALPLVNPLGLSPVVTPTVMSYHYDHLKGWTEKWPSSAFVPLTFGVALLAFGPLAAARRRAALPSGALVVTALACLALCVALKYGVTLVAGGLSVAQSVTALLSGYFRYLLLRCELLLLFAALVAAGTHLYLTAESRGRLRGRARAAAGVLLAAACWALPAAWLVARPPRLEWAGTPTVPDNHRFPATDDDRRLLAWIEDNLPPGGGDVGLAAMTARGGVDDHEHHIYPLDGGFALVAYGRDYRFRFVMPALEGDDGVEGYEKHVRDDFDAGWCLRNGIRYFYAAPDGLRENPGLAKAVEGGRLRPLHREGASAVYEVVDDGR